MHIDFLSVLPTLFAPVLREGVIGRAAAEGRFTWRAIPIRAFASGKHRITDEPPYGGGAGMVMKPEPLVRAIRWATHQAPNIAAPSPEDRDIAAPADRVRRAGLCVVLLDAGGMRFTQERARDYSQLDHLVLVCGRYEGVDERVRAHVDHELSVGDYVLTGGELAALVVADALVRLIPGTLGNQASVVEESHGVGGLLEYPQYTRPRDFEGVLVPDVLVGGDHAQVGKWRRQRSLMKTRERFPERMHGLSDRDVSLLDEADGKPPRPKKKR